MKSKLKKIVVPIFLAVFCGFLCGRLMFNIYEEKGSSTLNSNVIYLLLDTSYNNYDEMKASTISSNYIYYEDKGKYNVVVALTKNEDNISKIEELYNKKLTINKYLINDEEIINKLKKLITTLIVKAKENTETIMPGYTHMQRAQPITFAHHLMAYAEMFKRDIQRLNETYKRTDICPIGSCALAGTTYNLDRKFEANELGFSEVSANSLDGVSDRDFIIELLSDISIIMMHLSRISEEIILWSSWEFKFIELDDSFSTGSSIMPQKKNPDITELIRGKTGRVYGNLMAMLTVMKGTPLAYNKDMQEDKELIFDAIDTVNLSLSTIEPLIDTMVVLKENMKAGAEKGFINATDCADYLVEKGIPFRDAYKVVGNIVKYCIQNNTTLEKLDIKKYKEFNNCFEADIYNAVNLMNCVNKRNVIGGPAKKQVEIQIANFEKWLNI